MRIVVGSMFALAGAVGIIHGMTDTSNQGTTAFVIGAFLAVIGIVVLDSHHDD